MSATRSIPWTLVISIALTTGVFSQSPPRATNPTNPPRSANPPPRLEAVAETQLLMDGLARPNFGGLRKILSDKPSEIDAWKFARGQALLIAETGNLLMLRPPRGAGQDTWMARSTELREAAYRLARSLAAQDYLRSRSGLVEVANSCNRCHRSFRVPVRVSPLPDAEP